MSEILIPKDMQEAKMPAPSVEIEGRSPIEFLEPSSELLDEALMVAERYERGEIDYEEVYGYFGEAFSAHDAESFDCNSFVSSILERELELSSVVRVDMEKPNRNDYNSETEWEEALLEAVRHMRNTPEGKLYYDTLGRLEESIHANSDYIAIPLERDHDRIDDITRNVMDQVMARFSEGAKSRVIFLSDGEGKNFHDVHFAFILGPIEDDQDLLVVEKGQIGAHIMPQRLSDLVSSYVYRYDYGDLALNLCKKSVAELYPENI